MWRVRDKKNLKNSKNEKKIQEKNLFNKVKNDNYLINICKTDWIGKKHKTRRQKNKTKPEIIEKNN